MKRILLICSGLMMAAGCAYYGTEDRGTVINESSGAERMTNAPPETQARDINQRPYPGTNPATDAERNIDTRSGIRPNNTVDDDP